MEEEEVIRRSIKTLKKENWPFRIKVLLFHLYIEYFLDKLIKQSLFNPEKMNSQSFYQKVKLLEALGVVKNVELADALYKINNVRNKFVHNLDENIAFKESTNLIKKIPNLDNIKMKDVSIEDQFLTKATSAMLWLEELSSEEEI